MGFHGKTRDMQEVRCCICHGIITEVKGLYQSPSLHSVVCQICNKFFPPDDLEMMISLFYMYGGYFGKNRTKAFCLEKVIDRIGRDIPIDIENIDSINQRIMHSALLHGYTPLEFNRLLRNYIDD